MSSSLNPTAKAWDPANFTPSAALQAAAPVAGAAFELPPSNAPAGDGFSPNGDDEYDDDGSAEENDDDFFEDEFEIDAEVYEQHDQQQQMLMQAQLWQQQQQQQMLAGQPLSVQVGVSAQGFSNAAVRSDAGPPIPAAMFPGGKVPETPEEWQAFHEDLRRRQLRQVEQQNEERRRREAAAEERQARRAAGRSGPDGAAAGEGGSAPVAPPRRNPPPPSAAARSTTGSVAPSLASAPLTANGNRRWPKNHSAKKAEAAQKSAFESFANALLHAVSPFMAPLRRLTRTSLPHIKVDQRFGKRGQPETAVMQFVVAPVVVNYKPTHFHEVSPGDLLEFHHDFALVLAQIGSATTVAVSYGPDWKPFALPYCFVGCRDYAGEVLKLCPDEIPNSRSEVVYEDDVVKDITPLIMAVAELAPLARKSFVEAMLARDSLVALYDVFHQVFAPVGDYQIQVRNLHSRPSQYLLKTSMQVLRRTCPAPEGGGKVRVVINDDDKLWDSLADAANTFQSGRAGGSEAAVAANISRAPPAQPAVVAPPASVAATANTAASKDHKGSRKKRKPERKDAAPGLSPNAVIGVYVGCAVMALAAVATAVAVAAKRK